MRLQWVCTIGAALLLTSSVARADPSASRARAPDCWAPPAVPTLPAARVLVAYVSTTGRTHAMAESVATGAASVPRACVWLLAVDDSTPTDMLASADGIVLGAPVHNGNPASTLLRWIERWPFKGEPLRDRYGAVFITAGGIAAGAESSLFALQRSLLTFGMLIAGGEHWTSAYGAVEVNAEAPAGGPNETASFANNARSFGHRLASLAAMRAANSNCAKTP